MTLKESEGVKTEHRLVYLGKKTTLSGSEKAGLLPANLGGGPIIHVALGDAPCSLLLCRKEVDIYPERKMPPKQQATHANFPGERRKTKKRVLYV